MHPVINTVVFFIAAASATAATAATAATGPIAATAPAPQTRPATDAEVSSFASYYQQQFPGAHPGKPVFNIVRSDPKASWTISATLDSHPQRGLKALCRMNRSDFNYTGRWSANGKARPHAWIERSGCKNVQQALELLVQMPDADVLGLLENRFALLNNARILLAGNTACASQRSFRFAPVQLTVGSAGPSPEVLAGLVYRSDHGTFATVWARRNGAEYSVWNVSCP